MRVTNQMMTNNYMTDLQNSKENLLKVQNQMTSEKEINKPSDDPAKVIKIMQLNSDINTNKQYATNIDDATTYLDTSDTVLNRATTLMQRVREILVSSSGTTTDNTANKQELNQKIAELGQILNTKSGGKYIFGGAGGNIAPVTIVEAGTDPVTGNPIEASLSDTDGVDTTKLSSQVASGYSVKYGITAGDILNFKDSTGTSETGSLDLKTVLSNIVSHMNGQLGPDEVDTVPATVPGSLLATGDLTAITDAITNLTSVRSSEGTTNNTLSSLKDKNTENSANLTDILSKTQDIDIAEKTMEYTNMQNVYTATLQISSKVIQPSLMDYLK